MFPPSNVKGSMPRYFFDIHDSGSTFDDTGVECDSLEEVRHLALRALPDVAREEIPADGDRRTFTVVASDANRTPVYSATLNYTGLWLVRQEKPSER